MTSIYVNGAMIGSTNGGNWDSAYTDLQQKLKKAKTSDEIWMPKGIYKPTTTVNRETSFKFLERVEICGEFAKTEILREERNYIYNKTFFSSNLCKSGNKWVNSHYLVIFKKLSNVRVLNGFANFIPTLNQTVISRIN